MKPEIERVLSLLLMRFNLIPSQSIPLVEDWLDRHPGKSWTTVEKSLKSGRVIFKDGSLHEIKQPSSVCETVEIGRAEIGWRSHLDKRGNFKYFRTHRKRNFLN